MLQGTSWIKKISKNTCVLYIPNILVLDENFPFKIKNGKIKVLLEIDKDKLIVKKTENPEVS
jgi:hypothetical protein